MSAAESTDTSISGGIDLQQFCEAYRETVPSTWMPSGPASSTASWMAVLSCSMIRPATIDLEARPTFSRRMTSSTKWLRDATAHPAKTVVLATPLRVPEVPDVPDVVGMDLQSAQDTLQAHGFYNLGSHDVTGEASSQILDRNWTVVDQTPSAGTMTDMSVRVELG